MPECHKVVELRQRDFGKGPVTITEGNVLYRLIEDIVFDPVVAPWKTNPYNPLNAACPHARVDPNADKKDQIAGTCPKNRTNFKLGFPAAIIILCDGVVIDLNGYSIQMSKKFYLFQRFYAHIQIGPSPFETAKGPAPTFDTYGIFPSDITITSMRGRGRLGLTSHTSIMAVGNRQSTIEVSNIDFVDNEVGAGIFNMFGKVFVKSCVLDNCELTVPINGNFSGLIQNTSKLEGILNAYDRWFARLRRENVSGNGTLPNCDLNDLYQQQETCMKDLIDLARIYRVTRKECDLDDVLKVINYKIETLLDIKRNIGILTYSGNWADNYPVDITWNGADDETIEQNATLPYRQDVIDTIDNFKRLLKVKVGFEDLIIGVYESVKKTDYHEVEDPSLHEFYNPLGLPDGSAFYGFSVVNTATPGVGDFQTIDEDKCFGRAEFCGIDIQNIRISPIEVPGIDYKGEVNNDTDPTNDVVMPSSNVYSNTGTLKTMAGEILYMVDPNKSLPFFEKRVYMIEAIRKQNIITLTNEEHGNETIFPDIRSLTGTLKINDDELIIALKKITSILKRVAERGKLPSYYAYLDGIRSGIAVLRNTDLIGEVGSGSRYVVSLDQDVMQHKPKGFIAFKMEGLESWSLNDTKVRNIKNFGLDYNKDLGGVSPFNNHSTEYVNEGTFISGAVIASAGNSPGGDDSDISNFVFKNIDTEDHDGKASRFRFVRHSREIVISYDEDRGRYDEDCRNFGYRPPVISIPVKQPRPSKCGCNMCELSGSIDPCSTCDTCRESESYKPCDTCDHESDSSSSSSSDKKKDDTESIQSICLCVECERKRNSGEHPPNFYTKDKCDSSKNSSDVHNRESKCPVRHNARSVRPNTIRPNTVRPNAVKPNPAGIIDVPVRTTSRRETSRRETTRRSGSKKSRNNRGSRSKTKRDDSHRVSTRKERVKSRSKSKSKSSSSSSSSSNSSRFKHKSKRYCNSSRDAQKRRVAVSLIKDMRDPAKNVDLINALL